MSLGARLALKLVLMVTLLAIIVLFSRVRYDFVYQAF